MTLTYRNNKSSSCNYSDSYKNIGRLKRVCTTTPDTIDVNWFPIGHIRRPQHDLWLAVSIHSSSKSFIQLSLAGRPSTVKSTPVGDGIVFCLTKHVYIILCCMCHFIVFNIEIFCLFHLYLITACRICSYGTSELWSRIRHSRKFYKWIYK